MADTPDESVTKKKKNHVHYNIRRNVIITIHEVPANRGIRINRVEKMIDIEQLV